MEVGSEHPLGEAIVIRANELGISLPKVEQFQAIAGKGVEATVDGQRVTLGNRALMTQIGVTLNGSAQPRGRRRAVRGNADVYRG